MSLYLIEPYNAYAPKQKKKHWMEIAEEEAMMARIIAELKNQSNPENSPPVAQSGPVGISAGTGGGGAPEQAFFRQVPNGTYTTTPNAVAPAGTSVTFANASTKYVNVYWNFGDGTYGASNTVTHTFATTGSFTVSVTASNLSSASTFSSSVPVVTASFTATPLFGTVPLVVQFTNTSTNANTYLWLFGSGSGPNGGQQASSSTVNPTFTYTTGSRLYTVQLQATSSQYNFYRNTSSINYISASM
jgi:hypothetical protein